LFPSKKQKGHKKAEKIYADLKFVEMALVKCFFHQLRAKNHAKCCNI
jgi:hypothetical protein